GFGGGDGLVLTPIGTGTDEANAVALQPDGKIIAAGLSSNGTDNDFALARYHADGTLDTGFGGGDGLLTTPLGGDDAGFSVALQSNGLIVVGGNTDSVASPGNGDFALARYKVDGTLDSGFGTNGTLVTQVGASTSYGWALTLQEDGKIVLVGEGVNSHTTFALARYLGDTAPPTNPTLSSSSHSVGVWSRVLMVGASFAGGSDDYTGIDGYSFVWDTIADTVPGTAKNLGGGAAGITSPSLADGASHYLHLRTVDKAGNWSGAVHLGPYAIDTVPPTKATLGGAALSKAFQKSGSFRLALNASDGTSGVGSYAVRYRRAPLAGPFGPALTWKAALAASSGTFTGAPGSTYCLGARASDRAGNAGVFGSERCTAIPAGSRQLTRKGAWRRGFGFAHYQSSYSVSTRRGASLVARVTARRLALVATTCARCGVVDVFLGRRLLKRIDLHSRATKERRLIPIASFSALKRGRVAIVVASSGKPVIIEGLGAARR
ncbi:MAG: delta-60 repeat domain-containing protein, partial [Gaiellales bacterium]